MTQLHEVEAIDRAALSPAARAVHDRLVSGTFEIDVERLADALLAELEAGADRAPEDLAAPAVEAQPDARPDGPAGLSPDTAADRSSDPADRSRARPSDRSADDVSLSRSR